MKIEGIENIRNVDFAKVIVEFVLDYYEGKNVNVEELDSNTISINEDRYAMYTEREQDNLIDSFNNDRFSDAVLDVPADWREYINKKQWIDDNGILDFEDYWEGMDFDECLDYVTRIDGVYIYKLD